MGEPMNDRLTVKWKLLALKSQLQSEYDELIEFIDLALAAIEFIEFASQSAAILKEKNE